MTKRLLALTLVSSILFSFETEILFSAIKFNYVEKENGKFLNSETCSYSKYPGIIFSITEKNEFLYNISIEYNKGETTYIGSTWGGTPLKSISKNSFLYNLSLKIGYLFYEDKTNLGTIGKVYPVIGIGYRFWNRGKSNYIGDYDEEYSWKYFLIGSIFDIDMSIYSFGLNIQYQQGIDSKLKADLFNGLTFKLKTKGYKIEVPLKIELYNNYGITLKYVYDYWKVTDSTKEIITVGNENYIVYEPNSETKNNYLSIGIYYNF